MTCRSPVGLLTLLALALPLSAGFAQTSINPDISVIPRFLIETDDTEETASGNRRFRRPEFFFEELEVAIASYLNPFAKADVVFTLKGPDVEDARLGLEEVYATVVRGLPLDLNLRIGKFRVDYGKINPVHPHAWAFVTPPLSQQRFLGEEGLNDLGISASVLLPTGDIYTRLSLDLLRGTHIEEAAGMEDTTGASLAYAHAGRLTSFFPLTDESDLEVGVSGYTGIHDPYARQRFWYLNLDFKYKYKPDMYTSLTLQGEYLRNTRRVGEDPAPGLSGRRSVETRRITSSGLYAFAEYQFMKIYSLGARYDWSQSPYSREEKAEGVALFAGYYPVEETLGVRLQYQRTRHDGGHVVNAVALQLLFSLGPHKVHQF